MARYDSNEARTRPLDEYVQSLSWLDAERNTAEIRRVVDRLTDKGKRVYCVWTGSALSQKYAIDHCFAFAYWPNNDLWNLLPAHPKANASKSDKIPSAMLLEKASERILSWWSNAYGAVPFRDRFFIEAQASLPAEPSASNHSYESVFAGIQTQRLRLKVDQQIQEWNG